MSPHSELKPMGILTREQIHRTDPYSKVKYYYNYTANITRVVPELYKPIVNRGNLEDQLAASEHRILRYQNGFKILKSVRKELLYQVDKLAKRKFAHVEAISRNDVVGRYTGRLKKRYQRAVDDLKIRDLDWTDSIVKAFVKREKWHPDTFAEKAPRFIMPRDPRYGVLLAKYTKPIEDKLFLLKDQYGLRYFAKYYNARLRGECIQQKYAAVPNCGVFVIDASAFDAHVNEDQLRIEHAFYKKIFKNSRLLTKLLQWQLTNKIITENSLRMLLKGVRMSGDMNTSLGNCLIVHLVLLALQRRNGYTFTWLDDGDDCIIFYDKRNSDLPEQTRNIFAEIGHILKIEMFESLSDLVFCQQRLINGKLVRHWHKVISTCFVSHKHYHSEKFAFPLMRTISQAELSLNAGIPVLQPYFEAWLEKLSGYSFVDITFLDESILRRVDKGFYGARSRPITLEARTQFEEAFGLPVNEQHRIEALLVGYVTSYDLAQPLNTIG